DGATERQFPGTLANDGPPPFLPAYRLTYSKYTGREVFLSTATMIFYNLFILYCQQKNLSRAAG
ncbi:MAG TPA: hypothetical protein VH590_00800, partial [Ktedonobacterales bacterium]